MAAHIPSPLPFYGSAKYSASIVLPCFNKSRMALTRCDTGFTLANHASGFGIVWVGTKALDKKVSGKSMIIDIP